MFGRIKTITTKPQLRFLPSFTDDDLAWILLKYSLLTTQSFSIPQNTSIMALIQRWLRMPRQKTFLHFMSLRTGTEMITLTVLFNKVTGFYGLLSILTGVNLSPSQLSMYLYSAFALVLSCYLYPHIRKTSPLQCLTLAWFFIFDTLINTAYTATFALTWFLIVSAKHTGKEMPQSPGQGMIDDTAGFTAPQYNLSAVGVAAGTGASLMNTAAGSSSLAHGISLPESLPSLMIIIALTIIRFYCIFIICAYARQVLRQYMSQNGPSTATNPLYVQIDGASDERPELRLEQVFSADTPEGQGWKGKLGRAMVSVGESYWLGGSDEDSWARGLDGRFRTAQVSRSPALPGTIERERRARSGTGPSTKPSTTGAKP